MRSNLEIITKLQFLQSKATVIGNLEKLSRKISTVMVEISDRMPENITNHSQKELSADILLIRYF